MLVARIDKAISEAKRFLEVAEECKKTQGHDSSHITASPETGAVKRASMDLTRALSKLRKYDSEA